MLSLVILALFSNNPWSCLQAPKLMSLGFGAGNALVYQQDLDMVISNNGKECLLDEWTDLA